MPKKKFKITDAGSSSDSPDLVDCHIEETDNGYEVVAKRVVLASTTSTTPPFSFPSFDYEGWTWTLSVATAGSNLMQGAWTNNDNPTAEGDSWTAHGTGTGEGDEEDEARSASGSASA